MLFLGNRNPVADLGKLRISEYLVPPHPIPVAVFPLNDTPLLVGRSARPIDTGRVSIPIAPTRGVSREGSILRR